ncbi:hypothetical protein BaRGS_00001545, partial [Batillaria attramentaria]
MRQRPLISNPSWQSPRTSVWSCPLNSAAVPEEIAGQKQKPCTTYGSSKRFARCTLHASLRRCLSKG